MIRKPLFGFSLFLFGFICLERLLTGHWGAPYGGVAVPGSWLSGGWRGSQTKAQPAGPQPHRAAASLNGAMADPLPELVQPVRLQSWIYGNWSLQHKTFSHPYPCPPGHMASLGNGEWLSGECFGMWQFFFCVQTALTAYKLIFRIAVFLFIIRRDGFSKQQKKCICAEPHTSTFDLFLPFGCGENGKYPLLAGLRVLVKAKLKEPRLRCSSRR